MPTLDDLIRQPTKDELRLRMLDQLAGRGWVRQAGKGGGTFVITGTPNALYGLVVKVITAGQLGVAQVQFSTDNGATFSGTVTIPSNGIVAITGTGCSLTFSNSANGDNPSFIVGDSYSSTLSNQAFPVTSWQPFSLPLSMVENDAEVLEDLYALVRELGAAGFVQTAADEGLDEWAFLAAHHFYGLDQRPGVATIGNCVLTDPNGHGPYTKAAGEIVVTNAGGLRFLNVASVTVPHSGSVTASFRAESVGDAYNVANNTITVVASALPGVAVNNPDPGSGSWITSNGTSDETALAIASRCSSRWPSLGTGVPRDNYQQWAKDSDPSITKVSTYIDVALPGVVNVLLAGSGGGVSGPTVVAAQAYIDVRAPQCVKAVCASAANHNITLAGTLYVKRGLEAQALSEMQAAVQAVVDAAPIGTSTVYLSKLEGAIMSATGARNTVISSPGGDTALTLGQVATLTNNMVVVGV